MVFDYIDDVMMVEQRTDGHMYEQKDVYSFGEAWRSVDFLWMYKYLSGYNPAMFVHNTE